MMFHTNEVQTIVITRGQSAPVLPVSGLTFSSSGQGSFPLGSTYLSFGSSKLQIRSTMILRNQIVDLFSSTSCGAKVLRNGSVDCL